MFPNLAVRCLFYVFYFCDPGCRLSPSQSVGQSVCLSVSLALQVPLSSRAPDPQASPAPHFPPAGLRSHHAAVISRWQLARKKKTKNNKVPYLCLCVEEGKKNLPPRRNVCCQPGTGSERRAEPSRSRGGAAAGRRDIAAADRLRHPGLGRIAQPGPVSPLSLQPRQTPFRKTPILNPRCARRCKARICFIYLFFF